MAQISLQIPIAPPPGTSQLIDPSFAGFGIEASNLFSFTGYQTPNALTFNLINNLVNYTGTPPHIRIGGNTQDYMVFSADMQQYTFINNPNSQAGTSDSMLIGPKFFEVANRFPYGTPMTWGLNLAYQASDYTSRLTTMAQQVVQNVGNLKIVSFEIGNEPDLYLKNGHRTGPWTGQLYSQQWLDRANFLWSSVLKPLNVPSSFFEPAATASTIGTTFEITDLAKAGIGVQANGSSSSFISSWNQHDYYYFLGVSTYPLTLQKFIDFSTTETQFVAWATQIQQASQTPQRRYAVREMASVGPIGLEGITNTFAGALWTLNFLLYAATLNVTSVQMHMTDNSNTSAWQPIEIYSRAPFVRPNYYAHAAFSQIIGPTCAARVSPMTLTTEPNSVPQAYANVVRAYAVYQSDAFSSLVVLNGQVANVSTSPKQNVTVNLGLPAAMAGRILHLAYLTSAGADATAGTTWNGLSYEGSKAQGNVTVADATQRSVVVGRDGTVSVSLRDSQAVVAQLDVPVGALEGNETACAALTGAQFGVGPRPRDGGVVAAGAGAAGGVTRTGGADGRRGLVDGARSLGWVVVGLMGLAVLAGG